MGRKLEGAVPPFLGCRVMQVGPMNYVLDGSAHCHNLANNTELPVCSGDTALCPITLFTCWATVCKTVRTMLTVRRLSCLSVLSVTFMHCGQTVGRIKMKLGKQVRLGPGHIVLDGDPAPPPLEGRGGASPIFGPYLLQPNDWMDQDAT